MRTRGFSAISIAFVVATCAFSAAAAAGRDSMSVELNEKRSNEVGAQYGTFLRHHGVNPLSLHLPLLLGGST